MIINPYWFVPINTCDTDAQTFNTNAGITDATQQSAICQLVSDLKTYNIWTKMKAIYPFVGGTATTHKYNLKNPLDTDAAFRLVFSGPWVHSSTGILPNGLSTYADTFLKPSTTLLLNSTHISFYSRTNLTSGDGVDIASDGLLYISPYYNALGGLITNVNNSGLLPYLINVNTLGLHLSSRIGNTTWGIYRNGSVMANRTTAATTLSTNNILLGRGPQATEFSSRQLAFVTIGDGLDSIDAANLAWIIEKYQMTLNRSVIPWYDNGNLLLDTYSGASGGYSIRKIRNYYVGACLRVRRSNDNLEQDIYFDSSGNLDTTSLLSFVGSNNGFVTTFYNQTGNGNHLIQTTAARQPQIVSSGTLLTLNGKPSLRTQTVLQGFVSTTNFTFTQSYIATVFNRTGRIGVGDTLYIFDGSPYHQLYSTTSNWTYYYGAAFNTTIPLSTSQKLLTHNYDNTTHFFYENGNLNSQVNATITITNLQLQVMATFTFNYGTQGNLQEFIIYTTNKTSDRAAIETNIKNYYGI